MNDQGFAAERPFADRVVATLAGNEAVESITAYGDAETERFDAGETPMTWGGGADNVTLLSLYAEGALRGDAANLLQGAYPQASGLARRCRAVAARGDAGGGLSCGPRDGHGRRCGALVPARGQARP